MIGNFIELIDFFVIANTVPVGAGFSYKSSRIVGVGNTNTNVRVDQEKHLSSDVFMWSSDMFYGLELTFDQSVIPDDSGKLRNKIQ